MLKPGTFINVHFVDDSEIKKLNKKYRKINAVTDVLSFNLDEKTPDGGYYLGDVAISLPQAKRQAKDLGHSLEEEVSRLAEHGIRHLLGEHHE